MNVNAWALVVIFTILISMILTYLCSSSPADRKPKSEATKPINIELMRGKKQLNSNDEYLILEYNSAMDRVLALEKVNAELQSVIVEYARLLAKQGCTEHPQDKLTDISIRVKEDTDTLPYYYGDSDEPLFSYADTINMGKEKELEKIVKDVAYAKTNKQISIATDTYMKRKEEVDAYLRMWDRKERR